MTYREFFDLVRDMRAAQRRYFKDRTQGALEDSKRLEREVDRAILGFEADAVQPSLFGEDRS